MTDTHYDQLIELTRLARELEMGGYYNAAKLFWAAAFSEEIRASNVGLHAPREELAVRMDTAIAHLQAGSANVDLLAAMQRGRVAVQEDRGIPQTEIAAVHVCRNCGEVVIGVAPARCPSCGGFELIFREFPAVHYLDPLPPAQALHALETVPAAVESFLHGLNDDQMNQSPIVGEWSIREVFVHLLGTQALIAYRVNKILSEDRPSLKASGVPKGGEDLPARQIFEEFRASRGAMVAILRGIPSESWWRTGIHEEFGEVTLLQQASYFAKHDHAHLTQIEAIRQVVAP